MSPSQSSQANRSSPSRPSCASRPKSPADQQLVHAEQERASPAASDVSRWTERTTSPAPPSNASSRSERAYLRRRRQTARKSTAARDPVYGGLINLLNRASHSRHQVAKLKTSILANVKVLLDDLKSQLNTAIDRQEILEQDKMELEIEMEHLKIEKEKAEQQAAEANNKIANAAKSTDKLVKTLEKIKRERSDHQHHRMVVKEALEDLESGLIRVAKGIDQIRQA